MSPGLIFPSLAYYFRLGTLGNSTFRVFCVTIYHYSTASILICRFALAPYVSLTARIISFFKMISVGRFGAWSVTSSEPLLISGALLQRA